MTESKTAAVAFDQVSKSFGAKQILRNVSFEVPAGQALCILGRSGTGKSVTLKLIISLLKPDSGNIWIEQDEITRLKAHELSRIRRKMGYLFQDAALFDSLTLYENLALPLLRLTRKSRQEVDFAVDKVLRECVSVPAWPARWCLNRRFCWQMNLAADWIASRQLKSTN
jgi:phospholipid/cholesterol/gamma-HCH transport system ATP-binding protein